MNRHSYLRAYMAGVLVPTWFLLFILISFILARFVYGLPIPIERAAVFPMAIVPNLWGLWNLLYTAFELHRRMSLGWFGAILPALLMPAGVALAHALDIPFVSFTRAAVVLPVGMAVYYLVWKHFVGFLNRVVGLG